VAEGDCGRGIGKEEGAAKSLSGEEIGRARESKEDVGEADCGGSEEVEVSLRKGVKGVKEGKTELVTQSLTERLETSRPCLKGKTCSLKTTSQA